ncbi:hypothetical protein ACVWWD_005894 [Mesorhizobium sp. URHB0026]
MSRALSRATTVTVDDSGPGRLIVRQAVIRIVDRDMIAVDKVGWKDHQVGATGVTQRWKQDAAKAGGLWATTASVT